MKIKNGLILTTCILGFLGCGKENNISENTLFINPNTALPSINLSTLTKTISYIRLETIEESIIGKAHEIVIKEKFLYVRDVDQQAILIFDLKGKFISKLQKKGDGPDQYMRMERFMVDEQENYIDVFDFRGNNSRIIKYALPDFEIIKEIPLYLPLANSMRKEKEKNIYYFSSQQLENQIGNESINADIIAFKEGQPPAALFSKKIISHGSSFSPNTESMTTNRNGDIFASLMYNTTFFQLSGMQANPVLTIDFEGYGIDNSIGLKNIEEQKNYLNNETEGLASFPVLNIFDSDIIAFSYYFKTGIRNHLHHYIHFKKTDQIFHTRDIVNDLTTYPEKVYLSSYFYAVNHEVLHGDYLVDIVLPWHTNEGKIIEIPGVGTVQPEDNPVILLMRLKEEYR